MEIRFYNSNMEFLGVMENQTALIWEPMYFQPGEFELYLPITKDSLRLTALGNLVWMRGNADAAVIEDRVMEESSTKNEITVKGRFLSAYMDRRIIKGTVSFSGSAEVAMRQLLSGVTPIPRVELGTLHGFEEAVSFQATYKNLLTVIQKLAKGSGLGFRLRPDFDQRKLFFEVYKGVNRTASQGVNNRVIFSESYNNLNNTILRENDQLYKNVAYVGGEGEGAERVVVQVGGASDLELREVFVDARDLQREDMASGEYEAVLAARGWEKLAQAAISSSMECDTGADVNFHYKQHYDVGDLVTVKKRAWNITVDNRITSAREVYEHGGRRVEPTLGNPLPDTIDWSDS